MPTLKPTRAALRTRIIAILSAVGARHIAAAMLITSGTHDSELPAARVGALSEDPNPASLQERGEVEPQPLGAGVRVTQACGSFALG